MEATKSQVSPKQFQTFDLYVLQGWGASEVARMLKTSLASVYLAKHRVAGVLKKSVQKLQQRMESGDR